MSNTDNTPIEIVSYPSLENMHNTISNDSFIRIIDNKVSYSDFCKYAKPLDVLLFAGGDFVSSAIRKIERVKLGNGDFSHAGLVATRDLIDDNKLVAGKFYTWEITMGGKLNDGVPDVRGKSFLGVQIREFDWVFDSFRGNLNTKIAWCRLKNNPFNDPSCDRQNLQTKATLLYYSTLDKPYESVCCCGCQLGSALFPIFRKCVCRTGDERFFCSEFVAYVLKYMNVLSADINPHDVVPVDFIPGVDQDKSVDGNHAINCCQKPLYIV